MCQAIPLLSFCMDMMNLWCGVSFSRRILCRSCMACCVAESFWIGFEFATSDVFLSVFCKVVLAGAFSMLFIPTKNWSEHLFFDVRFSLFCFLIVFFGLRYLHTTLKCVVMVSFVPFPHHHGTNPLDKLHPTRIPIGKLHLQGGVCLTGGSVRQTPPL